MWQSLGRTVTNENFIHGETKIRLNSGNAFYTLLFRVCCLPVSTLKKLKIKIYNTIILPFVLYGFETWSLTLREEHRSRVFENGVLRKIFGLKRKELAGG
jgi:hypothetical protein